MIRVAVLDRGLERGLENNRRIQMKAVHACSAASPAFSNDRRAVHLIGEGMVLESPCSEEIILRASARDGRLGRSVHEKHIVALTPPIILVLQDRHGYTGVLAGALRVEPHVV